MFLEIEDFNTTLYDEIIDAVSREDDSILQAAIDAAISEAKGYLIDYDIPTIFSATKHDRHPLLLTFLKDIAVWHFITVGNPTADYDLRKTRYERAISWLKAVQKREISPDLPSSVSPDDEKGYIVFGSNLRRENHY
jgi:phage gp36-like protein